MNEVGRVYLSVLGALALHVRRGEVGLLVSVRRRDDVRRLHSATVFARVATRRSVRVNPVLSRVVTASAGAERLVKAVKQVVE